MGGIKGGINYMFSGWTWASWAAYWAATLGYNAVMGNNALGIAANQLYNNAVKPALHDYVLTPVTNAVFGKDNEGVLFRTARGLGRWSERIADQNVPF